MVVHDILSRGRIRVAVENAMGKLRVQMDAVFVDSMSHPIVHSSYPFCVTPTFRKTSKSMKTRKTVFNAICSIPVKSMHGRVEETRQRTNGEKHLRSADGRTEIVK